MATYREAGVDLDAAEAVVAGIAPDVTATWDDRVVGSFGGFAAGLRLPDGYRSPVLMMSTDGVGTKAEVARRAGRLDGLGFDLVAMCVDDLAAAGAEPLALTDYLAVGRLDPARVSTLVGSVARACAAAGVALLGGETAEHPGVMAPDAFDLSGAALGVVEDGDQIDGAAIRPGDVVLGLASPNLRSNGFSLVRRAVLDHIGLDDELPGTGRTAAEVLLEPSVIYAPALSALRREVTVHGLAHVTGGGIAGNLIRVLPAGLEAVVDPAGWEPAPVFGAVAAAGSIADDEMFRTYNMGIGFIVVLPAAEADRAAALLAAAGHRADVIGEVRPGPHRVRLA